MSWTDERVEQLRKMWLEGLSASAIAAELGNGVSRNAVIGKVHRLGLSGRAKAQAPAAPRRTKPTRTPTHPMRAASPIPFTRGNTALAADVVADIVAEPEPEPKRAEDVVIPLSERVTIMELRESMCRWPIGDPGREDFRFCGGKSQTGMPYCAHHATIAYQPVVDRRRDRERRAARV